MWTHVLRSAARPASAVVSIRIGGPALALAAAACGSAAGSVASANGAGGGTGPPTDAEAAEARRVLEAYFATTEPAEGGRGAVRLRKPVVDGEKSVGDYQRSLVDHDRSGTSDDEATVADPGPTRSPTAPVAAAAATVPWASTTLQALRELQAAFARARDWDQFHTPRNILIALTGEVGELAEIFQWKGEVARGLPEFTAEEKVHVGEEMSDVLLYLVRLADVCEIDLAAAVLTKVEKNAAKYDPRFCKGSSAKYTEYSNLVADASDGRSSSS